MDDLYNQMFGSLSEKEYDELRSLLVGLEVEELEKLKRWLSDPASFAEDISVVVPLSIKH